MAVHQSRLVRRVLAISATLLICYLLGSLVPRQLSSWTGRSSRDWKDLVDVLDEGRPPVYSLKASDDPIEVFPFVEVQSHPDRLDNIELSPGAIIQAQEAHTRVVASLARFRNLAAYDAGTEGIVMIGGDRYMSIILVSIRMLRLTNSTLPVTVFLPNITEVEPHLCEDVLPKLQATCLPIPSVAGHHISRFQYKVLALLASPYESNLFLDADNFPVSDPRHLFQLEVYRETGLVTWPDLWITTASKHVFQIVQQEIPDVAERACSEAGQILVSKRIHATTLLLALYYNVYGPNFFYKLLSQSGPGEGDKETFLLAASVLGNAFYQVSIPPERIGYYDKQQDFHIMGLVQFHPNTSKPQFIHNNMMKLDPAGVAEHLYYHFVGKVDQNGKIWGANETLWSIESCVRQTVLDLGCHQSEELCTQLKERWQCTKQCACII